MAFEFLGTITRGLFGPSPHVAKSGPQVIPITGSHPIFGGVKNIFTGNHESVSEPLPPSRHVFGSGVPVHNNIILGNQVQGNLGPKNQTPHTNIRFSQNVTKV